MKRVANVVLLLAVVLTVAACGGGTGNRGASPEADNATTETAAAPETLPEQGPVPAGEYRTETFELAFSFRVGRGWVIPGPEVPDSVALYAQGEELLGFDNVRKVFDPSELPEEVPVPAPEDMIAWMQEHPYLDAGEPTPASVGGISGTQLDVVASPAPEDYPRDCPVPCVPGWDLSAGPEAYIFLSGYKSRHIVLDVGGETVIVSIEAPEDEFEAFLPQAQEVLDSVEWEVTS